MFLTFILDIDVQQGAKEEADENKPTRKAATITVAPNNEPRKFF
jgi:hypothetical protein